MKKKYQIFISSTYLDLKDERQAVSKAVLDLGHIPSGMELFPASNATQLDYIKRVIDDCDYYLLIVGGRYGSLGEDGISFTEQEYNYAVKKELPVIAFIHDDIGELKKKNTESTAELLQRLEEFKARLQERRLTKYWSQISDLQSSVITSLTALFRDEPRVGWRRDTDEISPESLKRIEELNQRSTYWLQKAVDFEKKVKAYEDLANRELEVRYSGQNGPSSVRFSGEEIIREFAVPLSRGMDLNEIQLRLHSLVMHTRDANIIEVDPSSTYNFGLFFEVFEIVDSDREFSEHMTIRENKKYLLKAAFKPLSKVLAEDSISDEIPF